MFVKLLYGIIFLAIVLLLFYFFQPLKKGKGSSAGIKYRLVENWLHLPDSVKLGNPTGMAIDTNQNLVVFHRADRTWPLFGDLPTSKIERNTILIINKENGKLINSWGANMFVMPHGLKVDVENNIWVTDVALHQVLKFTHDGKLLMTFGVPGIAGNDSLHFNQPTDIAIVADGSFYVSDGYGNSRIVKFDANGKYLFEWGTKGNKEGQFNIPHGIALDAVGNIYVADRENSRMQIFSSDGKFIKQLTNKTFGNICAVAFNDTKTDLFAVDDVSFLKLKHRGSDLIVFDTSGYVRERLGRSGFYQGKTSWYHDIAVDKDGNIYVGDILGNTIQKFSKVF